MRTGTHGNGSIRRALVVLLLTTVVPILLVEAIVFAVLLQTARREEERANLEVARAVAQSVDAYILDVLREELALGLAMPALTSGERQTYLAANSAQYPAIDAFVWISPEGRILASPQADDVGIDVSDREYFRRIADGEPYAVSDLLTSRLSGEVAFAVARGIRTPGGALLGVMSAYVDPDRLAQALGLAREGTGTTMVFDRTGRLVYGFPTSAAESAVLDTPQARQFVDAALAGQESTGVIISPVDERARIAAAAPVPSIGWASMATRLEREVTAPLVRDFLLQLAVLLVIAGLALAVALGLARRIVVPIERLQQQAERIGRGDRATRVTEGGPAEVRALAATVNDMADRLQEREQEREAYIHTLSHDLRIPLTVATGHAEVLRDDLQAAGIDGELRASVAAVLAATRRMNVMIQDLVDTARSEAGQLTVRPTPLALERFVNEAVERAGVALDISRVQVRVPSDLPSVLVDPNHVERILLNLVSNGLKYSPPDAPVTIDAARDGGMVTVTVADRGIGIPPEEQTRLFTRFFRARGARKTEGIGLGLYISRLLVEANGGEIAVESEPGVGTTFRFTLPTAGQPPAV